MTLRQRRWTSWRANSQQVRAARVQKACERDSLEEKAVWHAQEKAEVAQLAFDLQHNFNIRSRRHSVLQWWSVEMLPRPRISLGVTFAFFNSMLPLLDGADLDPPDCEEDELIDFK